MYYGKISIDLLIAKANILCQLDWATECSDICSDITLGVSVRVFNEIDI